MSPIDRDELILDAASKLRDVSWIESKIETAARTLAEWQAKMSVLTDSRDSLRYDYDQLCRLLKEDQ